MDPVLDDPLRPRAWDDFIGQTQLKTRLDVHIRAALEDERMIDHVLLCGPPGFGKTTMAGIIASRLGEPLTFMKMPIRPAALHNIVRRWEGGVLFLDEIHAAPKAQQEDLLTLTEGGYLTRPNGSRIYPGWMTVVAATTEPEKVIAPLADRFPIKPTYDPYTDDEMAAIVESMCARLGFALDGDACMTLGRATCGTPRNAKSFVLAGRDLLKVNDALPTAEEILAFCRIESDGLGVHHLAYLRCLDQLGGTAGLRTLSSMLRQHESVIRELERILMDADFVAPTERGRELTAAGSRRVRGRPSLAGER